MGASESAAKMRVNRALEKLRTFLPGTGVSSTTAVIAGAISTNSMQMAPMALAKSVTTVAIAKGAGSSASTLTLMKGALKVMAWTKVKTAVAIGAVVILGAGTTTVAMKTFLAPVTIKDAYVKLYSQSDFQGEVLTILPWEAPSNDVAVRGDIDNFDGLPPDSRGVFNFNDKASSAVYLLPKGCDVVLYEHAKFDGQQFKLVGTGKVERIADFDSRQPGFDGITSSLHWAGVKEMAQRHASSAEDVIKQFEQTPNGRVSMEAVNFLESLKQKGRLPGIESHEHVGVEIPWLTFDHLGSTPHFAKTNLVFPLSLTLVVHATNINESYHYTVRKMTQTNTWQLQAAWRADAKGNVLQAYTDQ